MYLCCKHLRWPRTKGQDRYDKHTSPLRLVHDSYRCVDDAGDSQVLTVEGGDKEVQELHFRHSQAGCSVIFNPIHPKRMFPKVSIVGRNFLAINGAMRGMHIAGSIEMMRAFRAANPVLNFVPTMGALHDGHLALVKQAKEKGGKVVVSIFVNPTQFSAGEDLDKYPRQLEADLAKLKPLGVDCVFTPTQQDMYPGNALCHVEPAQFSHICEGAARPEFFRGVATVVTKLFNIVQPTYTFFGQKDISQCILIQRMVKDLNMPVHVQVCPTIREPDGLAMSSRNAYLTATERPACSVLYRALMKVKEACDHTASTKFPVQRADLLAIANTVLNAEPLVTRIEYVSVASHFDMTELASYNAHVPGAGAVISAAIRIGNVRLIDNVLVGQAEKDILGVV